MISFAKVILYTVIFSTIYLGIAVIGNVNLVECVRECSKGPPASLEEIPLYIHRCCVAATALCWCEVSILCLAGLRVLIQCWNWGIPWLMELVMLSFQCLFGGIHYLTSFAVASKEEL